jgi:hypothetical protein
MITRVQIPTYTDRWMMGDRYGEVVAYRGKPEKTIVHVKLDKSGKTIRVLLDDCTVV